MVGSGEESVGFVEGLGRSNVNGRVWGRVVLMRGSGEE